MYAPAPTPAFHGGIAAGYWVVQQRERIVAGLLVAGLISLGLVVVSATRRRA